MSQNQFIVIYYLLLWGAARVRGTVRRWNQPLLRGQEWFFNVHVQPDFYAGQGRKILNRFRLGIFLSYAIEVPLAAAIFLSGHLQYLMGLVLVMAIFIHIFHLFSVDAAERRARQFAVAEAEQPVATLSLSLKTRRLRDYTNRKLEVALALASIIAVIWSVRYYMFAPQHPHFLQVFGPPLLWLYAQIGLLLAKQIIVAWRAPIPQAQVEEHLAAREEARKLYLRACDWSRIIFTGAILSWPFLLNASPNMRDRQLTLWFAASLITAVLLFIWQEIRRKRVLRVALRAQPVKFPEFPGQPGALRWPLCYQPSAPMAVLKGVRGYSLNLANQFTQLGAAYLAGLFVVLALLRWVTEH